MTTIFFDLETVPESATVGMDLSNPPGWVPEAPPDFSDRRVAHNGRRFDFPLLQLRALKHGQLDLARSLHQAKPWDERLIDTCEWWPRTGWGASGSSARMDDICAFLGIDRPDNPIDGSQVLDAYVSGRLDEVVQHCLADVRVLREVFVTLATMRGVILGWDRPGLRG